MASLIETLVQMRHACLILAHNEFGLLQRLVSCLDDERNDLFVHVDRKVAVLPELHACKAGLFVLKDRVDVRWGDYSVVEGEYALFEAAVAKGPYQYYHLLSGADLPLKSQDYIHSFCDRNAGKEFIGYTLTGITPEVVRKVQRWHLFPGDFKNRSLVKRVLRTAFVRFQEVFGVKRNTEVDFKKGSQWVSVTGQMAKLFLDNREWAGKVFRNTFCPDEMVMQTLCWNSSLKENLFNTTDDGAGCMRAIGWRDGQLHDWCEKDFEELRDSPALFARKFNAKDLAFLDRVVNLSKG